MRLLLASGSETRRRMLSVAGLSFEIAAPDVDEQSAKERLIAGGASPREVVMGLAELKARSAYAGYGWLVLGSDQVLETESGTLLSKAGSRDEAERQLRDLAGRPHRLHSAAVLMEGTETVWRGVEMVTLHMRGFSDDFLGSYLDEEWEQVRWNVGCYAIEGRGVQLFERIEGSHFAILGMPLLPLLAELRARGLLTS